MVHCSPSFRHPICEICYLSFPFTIPHESHIFVCPSTHSVSFSFQVLIVSNAHAKVESSTDNNGKSKTNDIGNKDAILGGDESSNKADQRTIYDELTRNKFTIARYVRDVKPAMKITPIIKNKVSPGCT